MRRLPRRKGISFGTISMLAITALIVLSCGWLFPKLLGETDFQFNAKELAVAFDRSYTDLIIETDASEDASSPEEVPFFPVQPATPPQTPTPEAKLSFRLTAAGSVTIGSAVQKAMTDDSGYHFDDLFSPLQGEIQSDLALLTLENTVISSEKLTESNIPLDALSPLRSIGFHAVCLGYPGTLNSGISGLHSTQEAIRSANMTPYGAYTSQEQRDAMTYLNVNGISVALLSYQSELTSTSRKNATKEEQAFATAELSLPVIAGDIYKARSAGVQVVIVSLSWGKENATKPTQNQRELAQGIADAGADIILGTHTGTVQTIEILTTTRGAGERSHTLCAYSLGNLFSNDREKRANISGLLLHANITYDPSTHVVSFDQLSYTPTYVWRGKKTDKTVYAIVASDVTPPDYVKGDQLSVMERSLALIQSTMEDTPIVQRKPGEIFQALP